MNGTDQLLIRTALLAEGLLTSFGFWVSVLLPGPREWHVACGGFNKQLF